MIDCSLESVVKVVQRELQCLLTETNDAKGTVEYVNAEEWSKRLHELRQELVLYAVPEQSTENKIQVDKGEYDLISFSGKEKAAFLFTSKMGYYSQDRFISSISKIKCIFQGVFTCVIFTISLCSGISYELSIFAIGDVSVFGLRDKVQEI